MLIKTHTMDAFRSNIEFLVSEGKPKHQAYAIACSIKAKAEKKYYNVKGSDESHQIGQASNHQ